MDPVSKDSRAFPTLSPTPPMISLSHISLDIPRTVCANKVFDPRTDFISCKQSFDADIQSPENMIVDPEEYVEQSENEKDDIAIIDPDEPRPTPADDSGIVPVGSTAPDIRDGSQYLGDYKLE
ncbi:ubiquitin-specific protease ubp15 [Ciborinia camelliae]|nr:ubiquitin-specific protease ubp15 [Ciborinia camelliae]